MYEDLAIRILDYLSEDARWWPGRESEPGKTKTVSFRFSEPNKASSVALASALRQKFLSTYATESGFPLVLTSDESSSDAIIALTEEERDGVPGFGYEISFGVSEDIYPGWFAIRCD